MLSNLNAGLSFGGRSSATAATFGHAHKPAKVKIQTTDASETGSHEISWERTPKPSWGRRNTAKLLLCLSGIAGFFGVPKVYDAVDARGTEQIAIAESRQTEPTDIERAQDWLAKVQKNPVAHFMTRYYKIMIQFECLFLSLALLRSSFKRNMDVEDLWAVLHNQGLKGQGRKVGLIVQDGVLPGGSLAEDKLNVFEPNNSIRKNPEAREMHGLFQDPLAFFLDPVGPQDRMGKDTALASIISRGNPESTMDVFLTMSDDVAHDMASRLYEVIRRKDMDMLSKTSYLYAPLIKSISDSLKDSVDKGHDVVVVAQSLDSANHLEVLKPVLTRFLMLQAPLAPKIFQTERPYHLSSGEMNELRKFFAFLNGKLMQMPLETAREGGLGELLKPWEQALDYARQKNVAVLIPAGDSGNHHEERPYVVGNMNLLGMVDNEALMPVGSSNEQSRISASSSEWNELYQPFIAANGTGELNSENRLKRDWFTRIRLPLGGLHHKIENLNPIGTRYACADLANVILFMKQIDPDLSVQDVRGILNETADPFDPEPVIVEHPKIWASRLAHGMQSFLVRKLQQSNVMDPVTMRNFIDTFESRLNLALGDAGKAAYIARLIDKIYVEMTTGPHVVKKESVLKRLAAPRPEQPADASWRISDLRFAQQQMEALPEEDRQTVLEVLGTLTGEFRTSEKPTLQDQMAQVASRKAKSVVNRREAVLEVERRKWD